MSFTLHHIVILFIAVILLIFLAKYLWDSFFIPEKSIIPVDYLKALNEKKISLKLEKAILHYPDKARAYFFWRQMKWLDKYEVEGAVAELGVYKGETAVLLKQLAHQRDLYLFDTFSGFPPEDLQYESGLAATYTPENFADTDLESVRKLFDGYSGVHFCEGYFPDSAAALDPSLRFAMVSVDMDLYKPTISALKYFYPRLAPGGIIIIHDYNYKWEGLVKAVDEFLLEAFQTAVLIPDKDCSVVITKPRET